MATLYNQITAHTTPEKVWHALTEMELLATYDPIVVKSTLLDGLERGLGARRHCETRSGWFKEEVSEWVPHERLAFRLFACNQPMTDLTHTYHIRDLGAGQVEVRQVMDYTMKFGWLGRLMDVLMVKRKADQQIKLFFQGLKAYVEEGKTK